MSDPTFARPDRFFLILWGSFVPAGALLGALVFPDTWTLLERVGLGTFCGIGCALILTVNRVFGAYNTPE